jgi:flagellar hook-associated protein 2
MSTTSSAIFNGNSRYAQDFQSLISRAVAIASLPITQMTQEKTQVTDRATALSGLDTKFQSLAAAVTGIESSFGWASYHATVSDPDKLSATLGSGAMEGDYSIDIVRPGAYATSISHADWDPTGSHTYQISLNGVAYDLHPTDASAAGVTAAINADFSDQVRATVVNVGTTASPAYRISLQGTQLGDLAPDILRDGSGLQDQKVTGQTARYIVNDSGYTAESSTRTIQIANGLTVNLLGGDPATVTVNVSRSPSALGNALANFANAYNQTVDELSKQHGSSAGALSGDSVVNGLSHALGSLSTYAGQAGAITGLASLGLDLDTDGHLTLDSSRFQTAAADSTSVEAFFGSSTTSGFLKAATDALHTVQQTNSGLLPAAEASAQSESVDLDARISAQQDRVDELQKNLQDQMAAADALIATMEQQYNYITGMFQAMQTAAQMYK